MKRAFGPFFIGGAGAMNGPVMAHIDVGARPAPAWRGGMQKARGVAWAAHLMAPVVAITTILSQGGGKYPKTAQRVATSVTSPCLDGK